MNTHSSQAGLSSFRGHMPPPSVTIYAAVIEWPARLADAEPSLILARSEVERDAEICDEISETARMQSADTWTRAITKADSEDWQDWLEALDEHAGEQPFITTYTREV